MTIAVCFHCGAFKLGAWTACPHCGVLPSTEDDYAVSMALTDHYLDQSKLEEIAQSVKTGQRPHLDAATRDRLVAEMKKSSYFNKLVQMQSESAPVEPRTFHYKLAYETLPVLAMTDPRLSTGLFVRTPELDMLGDLWQDIQREHQVADVKGPIGELINLPQHKLVVVTMPPPVAPREAYYVGIAYPRSWFDDKAAFDLMRPNIRVFILAKNKVGRGDSTAALFVMKGLTPDLITDAVAPTLEGFAGAVSTELAVSEPVGKAQNIANYYLSLAGETQGPYTWEEVTALRSRLPPETLLWDDGVKEWRRLADILPN